MYLFGDVLATDCLSTFLFPRFYTHDEGIQEVGCSCISGLCLAGFFSTTSFFCGESQEMDTRASTASHAMALQCSGRPIEIRQPKTVISCLDTVEEHYSTIATAARKEDVKKHGLVDEKTGRVRLLNRSCLEANERHKC